MQSKFFLLLVLVSAFCVSHVSCQENGDNIWKKFRSLIDDFVDAMRGVWNKFKSEVKSRAGDMSSWTSEALDAFKIQMKDWINKLSGTPESEREDMRNFIERLRLPDANEQ